MASENPVPDWFGGTLDALLRAFGPVGALAAIVAGVLAWFLLKMYVSHTEERLTWLKQIEAMGKAYTDGIAASEDKRRKDGIAQFAKVDEAIGVTREIKHDVKEQLYEIRIQLAGHKNGGG